MERRNREINRQLKHILTLTDPLFSFVKEEEEEEKR